MLAHIAKIVALKGAISPLVEVNDEGDDLADCQGGCWAALAASAPGELLGDNGGLEVLVEVVDSAEQFE